MMQNTSGPSFNKKQCFILHETSRTVSLINTAPFSYDEQTAISTLSSPFRLPCFLLSNQQRNYSTVGLIIRNPGGSFCLFVCLFVSVLFLSVNVTLFFAFGITADKFYTTALEVRDPQASAICSIDKYIKKKKTLQCI